MSADFTPTMGDYTELKPFRYWCQKVLPLVYDDTLSYYELLCKVVDYLNKTMEDVETLHGDVDDLHDAYVALQGYVNNYFDNLDVQQEINNKLDAMALNGSLSALISPLLPDLVAVWLSEHITPTTPAVDDTLTISEAAADAKVVGNNFAPTYAQQTYAVNDIVKYNGKLYRCISAIGTAEAWTAAHWSAINTAGELKNLLNDNYWSDYAGTPLFNNNNLLTDSGYIGSGGDQDNGNFIRTPYIPIKAGDSYEYYNLWGNTGVVWIVVLYDKGKNILSHIESTGSLQSGTVTASADGYIRFSTLLSYISEYGSYIKPSNSIQTLMLDNTLTSATKAATAKVTGDRLKEAKDLINAEMIYSLPLLNEKNVFTDDGYYVSNSGVYQANTNYICTPKIYARTGDKFYYQNLWSNANLVATIACFSSAGVFDSTHSVIGTGLYQTGTFEMPANGYIIVSVAKSYLSSAVLNAVNIGINGYFRNSIYELPALITKGVILDTLGDSITKQGYLQESQKWQATLKSILGFSETYNHGVDMSTVSDQAGRNGMCTDARINDLNVNAGVVIVMGGMNDWTASIAIGNKTYDNVDTSTFFGACNVMFRKLRTKYTAGRIIAFGTTFGYLHNYQYFSDETGYKNNQGLTALEYSQAMMESAAINGIEHYNLGGNVGISDGNKDTYLLSENEGDNFIHPNYLGSYKIGQFMCKYIGVD